MNSRSRIWVIYVKELVDILRDRRTLIAMIVVPVLLYPLLMLGSVQAISRQEETLREDTLVVIATPDAMQKAVLEILIQGDREALRREETARTTSTRVASPEAQNQAEPPQPLKAKVIVASGDMRALVRERKVHVGVEFLDYENLDPETGQLKARTVYDSEEIRSELAAHWVMDVLQRCGERMRAHRLERLGIPLSVVEPVVIERRPIATTGSVLSQILPLILVLMTITGAIYPAIDLTAGERERGTLETLMVCPVPVIHLVVGKFMVVTTIAIMGAVLNLASISATVYFGGFQAVLSGSQEMAFPFAVFPIILLALVPFAIFFSAVLIAVCSYAHTFKEAQNYVTPIILAALVPGGIAALPASKLSGPMLVMPVANMVLLTKELLLGASAGRIVGGGVTWVHIGWVLASTVLYAAAAVAVAAKIFGTESVIFADTGSLRSAFARRLLSPARRPSISMVALVAALLFPAWFYLQSWLNTSAADDLAAVLRGTAQWMPVCFVLFPLGVMLYWKVGVGTTWRLGVGRLRHYVAAVVIGLTAWAPLHECFLLQSRWIPPPEGFASMDTAFVETLTSMPWWWALLLVAVVPGLCEELFFRGFFMSGMSGVLRKWGSIVATACVFGVFHMMFIRIPLTILLGVVLGYLCWQARSIWPAVLAHVLHNAGAVVRAISPRLEGLLGINPSEPMAHLPVAIWLPALVLLLLALAMVSRRRENDRALQDMVSAPA